MKRFLSCKMITYGRVSMLEESLYSFLQQDYPDELRELVIVNDYPLQKLVFDHPFVRIYNLDETFSTIGEKENYATSLCSGDIVCQFDDDDLALPNHLENVNKFFEEGTELLHWKKGIYMNDNQITAITNLGNSGIVYSKKGWERIGRYPLENAGYDSSFTKKIKSTGDKVIYASPEDSEVSWIYCWSGKGYHMSGMGTDDGTRPNVIQRHSQYIENLRKQGKIPTGIVNLVPNWKHDYQQKLKDFVNK